MLESSYYSSEKQKEFPVRYGADNNAVGYQKKQVFCRPGRDTAEIMTYAKENEIYKK